MGWFSRKAPMVGESPGVGPASGVVGAVPQGRGTFVAEDIFTITGRGVVLAGTVTSGGVSIGMRAVMGLPNGSATARVTGIEVRRRRADSAATGEQAGVLLGKLEPSVEEVLRDALRTGVVQLEFAS